MPAPNPNQEPIQSTLQGLSLTPPPLTPPSSTPAAQASVPDSLPQFDPQKLADIHLPEAISFWPSAPGWWILLALIAFLVLLIIVIKIRVNSHSYKQAKKFKQLRTQAQQQLSAIKEDYQQHNIAPRAVKHLSIFLRRYALSVYPRNKVASLTEQQWLEQLDILSDSDHFSKKYSTLLLRAPYQSENKAVDTQLVSQLFDAAQALISSPPKPVQKQSTLPEAENV